MVQNDDLKCAVGGSAQTLFRARQLRIAKAAGLVTPRTHRVEADDVQSRGRVGGLRRLPLPLELAERSSESPRERVRDVVVAGYREHRRSEPAQEARGARELIFTSAMAQVAARDHELRGKALDQHRC